MHNGRLGTWRRLGTWPQRYRALALVPSGAVERVGFSGIAEDRVFVLARTRAGRTHGLKLRLVGPRYRALAPGPSGPGRARGLQLRTAR